MATGDSGVVVVFFGWFGGCCVVVWVVWFVFAVVLVFVLFVFLPRFSRPSGCESFHTEAVKRRHFVSSERGH